MTEDFNDDQKKESLSLKNLALKILFFLTVVVVSYNLFFKNNNSAEDLTKIEKKEKIIKEFGYVLNDYTVKRDTIKKR